MACERNRSLELEKYLNSLGIDTNISKNKARGHNGVFIRKFDGFRIDVSKDLDEEKIISVLLHEFAHYVHYLYDNDLKSLDFVFGDANDEIREELIKITVYSVPKDFASSLYQAKDKLSSEIKHLAKKIKESKPDFKLSEKCKDLEKTLINPVKYLLKYDRIKYLNKIYSVKNLDENISLTQVQKEYITLKSKQRCLKRINSKINRLNKYYNNPTELFARFVELYYTKSDITKKLAPIASKKIKNANIKEFSMLEKIFK